MYFLKILEDAELDWVKLDGGVKEKFSKIIERRLVEPHISSARLKGDLAGCYKIVARKSGHRLVYFVDEELRTLFVISVGKREEKRVYFVAARRLSELN